MSLRLFPLILLLGTNSAIYIENNIKVIEDLYVELLQLREDMRIVKENYRQDIVEVLKKHEDDLGKQNMEIEGLKKIVAELEKQIATFQEIKSEPGEFKRLASSMGAVGRTCHELKLADQSLESGMFWIDPDGHGAGDAPIHVFCNMTSGSTSILHDREYGCWDADCYNRSVHYNASIRQMTALMELSSNCQQSIQYDCEIQSDGEFRPLWRDRGTQSFTETLGESYFSTAKIKVKSYLPVMRLNYGCIQPASGRPILSRLECDGRNSSPTQPPTSCRDLWQAGNILSGFYFVQPSRTIEVVFCNMTQVPAREETIVSAFVSSEQMDSLASWLEETEENVHKQAGEMVKMKDSIDQLNLSLSNQNQSTTSEIRKIRKSIGKLRSNFVQKQNFSAVQIHRLESSNEKLITNFEGLLASQMKQNENLAELQRTVLQHILGVLQEDDIYNKLTANIVAMDGSATHN